MATLAYQLCVPTGHGSDPQTTAVFLDGLRLGHLCAPNLGGGMAQCVRINEFMEFCAGSKKTEEYGRLSSSSFTYPEVAAGMACAEML